MRGTYVFMLTVTYGTLQATDTVTLTVRSVVADAGPDRQVRPGTLVTLDGSASLGGARIQGYTWSELTATGVALTPSGADPAKATFTAGEPGTVYEFDLLVESTDGDSSQDTVTVTVPVETGTTSTGGCAACAGTAAGGGLFAVVLLLATSLLAARRRGAWGAARLP